MLWEKGKFEEAWQVDQPPLSSHHQSMQQQSQTGVARRFSTWKDNVGGTLGATNTCVLAWQNAALASVSSNNFQTTAVKEWGEDCGAERVYHIPSNPLASGK